MNLVTDPGFELNSPAWVTTDPAANSARVQSPVLEGGWSWRLANAVPSPNAPPASVSQDLSAVLVPGQTYPVSAWVLNTSGASLALVAYMEKNFGSEEIEIGAELGSVPPGWSLWQPGSFVADGVTTNILRFSTLTADPSAFGPGAWYLDDVSVGTPIVPSLAVRVARHRHLIIAKTVEILKEITGPAYWTDLGGRVFLRLREPTEMSPGEIPCVFVIEIGPSSPIRNDEHGVKSEINLALVGYVQETSQDVLASTASPQASKLRDDIFRVLLYNTSLQKLLTAPLLLKDEEIEAGVDPGFGKVYVGLRLPYHIFKEDLGPLAP